MAQEWAKLDKVAPSTIKSSTSIVAAAYAAADAAHRTSVTRDTTFDGAANTVAKWAAANCAETSANGRGTGDDGDGHDGGRGPGGRDANFQAIQACMQKKGITLPQRGDGPRPNPPVVQKTGAKNTATSLKPGTTTVNGKGHDDADRGPNGPGGPGRGQPQFDAKTQKALQECFAETGRK